MGNGNFEVKRYDVCGEHYEVYGDRNGDYVLHEDYAKLEAQVKQLAAENAALKAGIGFFSYDSSGCYEEHDTAEKATAYAEDSISEYRDNAPDGWSDEVGSVVWGVIMQRATMTGLRPVTEEDNVASHIKEFCDYALLPNIETPATDTYLSQLRNEARAEIAVMMDGHAARYDALAKQAEDFGVDNRYRFTAAMFRGVAKELREGKAGEVQL